jgi:hypothetical protein
MMLKVILCQGFSECVSNLVLGVHREEIDESLAYMFAKMMVAYVNVLGDLLCGEIMLALHGPY